jgi:hypothetical protein
MYLSSVVEIARHVDAAEVIVVGCRAHAQADVAHVAPHCCCHVDLPAV